MSRVDDEPGRQCARPIPVVGDVTTTAERAAARVRKLLRIDVLIVDDFALRPMNVIDTAEVYEIIVERHRRASTIVTSNRDPGEMLAQTAGPFLAQSAIDRLHSNAHELVIDGQSYRRRQRPGIDTTNQPERSSPRRH